MAYSIPSSYAPIVASNAGYAPSSGYAAVQDAVHRAGAGHAYIGSGESVPGVCRRTCQRYGVCTCKG
jgi:hypothetical protein